MNREQFLSAETAAKHDLDKISERIACIDKKLVDVDDAAQLETLNVERGLLEVSLEKALAALHRLQWLEVEVALKQKHAVEHKERARKEKIFEKLKANLPKCVECGGPSKLVEGLKNPDGRGGNWWVTETANEGNWRLWFLNLLCADPACRVRFTYFPDESFRAKPKPVPRVTTYVLREKGDIVVPMGGARRIFSRDLEE